MKNLAAAALSNAEIQEVLEIQKWATYVENHPLRLTSSLNGSPIEVHSFTLENVPKLDLLVIFGGYPRVLRHMGEVMMKSDQKFAEDDPVEIAALGYKPNKGQDVPGSIASTCMAILEQMGFPPERVYRNRIEAFSTDTAGDINELKEVIRQSDKLSKLDCPRIGLVTEAGYSLTAAQQFAYAMPDCQLYFYETPVTQLCDRVFDVERIVGGYGVDVIIACALNTLMDWHNGRLPLPKEKIDDFPGKGGIIATVRKYFNKGYGFYLPYPEQWELMGFSRVYAQRIAERRKAAITGYDLKGEKVGEPLETSSLPVIQRQLEDMVDMILDEWMKYGKYPC